MTETSPKVPTESRTHRVPIFSNNSSRFGCMGLLHTLPSCTKISMPSMVPSYHRASTLTSLNNVCKCPHVLIADDDPFQAFYYRTLFLKSMDFDNLAVDKSEFSLGIYCSGEELLEQYKKIKACGCDNLMLIITDYNMGKNKLNGVELITALGKAGYNGKIVLRTSETEDFLCQKHKNLAMLINNKTISGYITKDNHNETKELIHDLLAIKID